MRSCETLYLSEIFIRLLDGSLHGRLERRLDRLELSLYLFVVFLNRFRIRHGAAGAAAGVGGLVVVVCHCRGSKLLQRKDSIFCVVDAFACCCRHDFFANRLLVCSSVSSSENFR